MSRYIWLIGPALVGVITLSTLLGAAALIYHAHSDPSVAVEADYYNKAVHWDDAAAQQRQNNNLGWRFDVGVIRGDYAGAPDLLRVTLVDRADRPIADALVRVETFHNARSADRRVFTLTPCGEGVYEKAAAFDRPGIWEFRITAEHGADTATATLQRSAPPREGFRS